MGIIHSFYTYINNQPDIVQLNPIYNEHLVCDLSNLNVPLYHNALDKKSEYNTVYHNAFSYRKHSIYNNNVHFKKNEK